MRRAELSHAILDRARLAGADLNGANLHAMHEQHTEWSGADRKGCLETDRDLLEAERWRPPPLSIRSPSPRQ